MLTFSITIGAVPWFLTAKSCSTTTPDETSANSKRSSGKTAFGPLNAAPGGANPSLAAPESCATADTAARGELHEARMGNAASKPIVLVVREITKCSPSEFSARPNCVSASPTWPACSAELRNQIEAQLCQPQSVVVVLPEETYQPAGEEGNG